MGDRRLYRPCTSDPQLARLGRKIVLVTMLQRKKIHYKDYPLTRLDLGRLKRVELDQQNDFVFVAVSPRIDLHQAKQISPQPPIHLYSLQLNAAPSIADVRTVSYTCKNGYSLIFQSLLPFSVAVINGDAI